jgi:DNA-binding transcriptional regulator YiaG
MVPKAWRYKDDYIKTEVTKVSDFQKYIANRKQTDKEFTEGYDAGYEALKLGAIVKELRLSNGMTQEELARKLNTKNRCLSYGKSYDRYAFFDFGESGKCVW